MKESCPGAYAAYQRIKSAKKDTRLERKEAWSKDRHWTAGQQHIIMESMLWMPHYPNKTVQRRFRKMRGTCGEDVRATILFFPEIGHKYSMGPFVTEECCEPDFYLKQTVSDAAREQELGTSPEEKYLQLEHTLHLLQWWVFPQKSSLNPVPVSAKGKHLPVQCWWPPALSQLSSQVPALQNSPSHLSLIGTFVRRLIKERESWTGSQWLNYLLVPGSDPAEPRLRQLDRSL